MTTDRTNQKIVTFFFWKATFSSNYLLFLSSSSLLIQSQVLFPKHEHHSIYSEVDFISFKYYLNGMQTVSSPRLGFLYCILMMLPESSLFNANQSLSPLTDTQAKITIHHHGLPSLTAKHSRACLLTYTPSLPIYQECFWDFGILRFCMSGFSSSGLLFLPGKLLLILQDVTQTFTLCQASKYSYLHPFNVISTVYTAFSSNPLYNVVHSELNFLNLICRGRHVPLFFFLPCMLGKTQQWSPK